MHRHAYTGTKFSRAIGPRRALLRGLLDSLILYERIETTESKAKALAPYFERQVTRAKAQTLADYRAILAETINPVAAAKLNYDLVKGFQSREGGYTRIIKTGKRLGDGASMAVIELVLDKDYSSTQDQITESKKPTEAKKSTKKTKESEVKTKITGVSKPKQVAKKGATK